MKNKGIPKLAHLFLEESSQKTIKKFMNPSGKPYNIPIQFQPTEQASSRWNRLMVDKLISQQFRDTMKCIQQCPKLSFTKCKEQYPQIQQLFLTKMHSFINQKSQDIILHQCDVHRAICVQQKLVYGVFFHRKLNLPKQCYSTQITKEKQIKYRMQRNLRKHGHLQLKRQAEDTFEKERLYLQYRDTYQGFTQSQYIFRSLYLVVADVKMQIDLLNSTGTISDDELSYKLGFKGGETQYLLQIETYKVPYQEDSYAITDIDFFMKGNPYFA